ncbi:MAG: bifunctional tetrahydrofolate synthase/dihydrofolate synthase [Comamonadaceae bacterium]|jgi:dihydrofolate synthase/folylpolyglutamate synthase|uniref:Dihydrofolate synthase/folylpolyglutamate synthase n=1 Tax=Hydrogenophaga borbori TaxID=2294117 RepID=A0A372EL14_9BURK|nr:MULTISPECIES: bifunctional tetrahydrofolate synthase/dihydrofolate synthase [Hydrogenophaga]NCT96536.1 bifunctional tetrahydrofolate synthase/dihydrofolate synthase [Comamonadaceae bacterium]RFP80093.1 bifunctional tetrahydrofolate synthase/dihydrofolate synthase [Hydrogenophaga borbori]WQB84861.1 bifunctional tetrahydrofolate synthase/dihydrofolate synthase [Hydrogenophaga sp. SNF1]
MLEIPVPDHPVTLADWLAHAERLHPQAIDMGLERVMTVARRMGLQLSCPVITVAGTNGKGSTCAMLESIYTQSGYRTGVYSSPHLVHFEERCRIAGEVVSADTLVPAMAEVDVARRGQGGEPEVSLTYFEFTTLAILRTIAREAVDVAILEVGLGGRLDAVNILDADCAVITSIDLDHMALLGPDRESIGREKAGIMRTGRPVVVSDPAPPQSLIDHAREIDAELWRVGVDFHVAGDQQQWGWAMHPSHGGRRYSGLAYPALRGANQLLNAAGALAAIEALRGRLPVTAQAVRTGFVLVELPGRFQIVPGRPALVLDVAHNPHSVAALAANLDAMGFYPRTHAVFGAMADKDLGTMLARIAPLIDRWYLTDLPLPRASRAADLKPLVEGLKGPGGRDASLHRDPREALTAALSAADPADRILVFGSFYTVGGVLQDGLPKLAAPHLAA